MSLAVTGVENSVGAVPAADAAPSHAGTRSTVPGSVARHPDSRRGCATARRALTRGACALMTDSERAPVTAASLLPVAGLALSHPRRASRTPRAVFPPDQASCARARTPPVPVRMVATASAASPALRTTTASPAPGRRGGRRPAVRTSRPRRTSLRASTQPPGCRKGCEAACPPRNPPGPVRTICASPRHPWFDGAPASLSAKPLPTFTPMGRLRRTPHLLPDPAPLHAGRETPGTPRPTSCSPRAR